jgi:hypothetical protein
VAKMRIADFVVTKQKNERIRINIKVLKNAENGFLLPKNVYGLQAKKIGKTLTDFFTEKIKKKFN